jgi:hypothetical protein
MFKARFKPVSNQADWATTLTFNDRIAGTPIDITGLSFTLTAQLLGCQNAPTLNGSTATGELTNPSLGVLQVYFPASRMQGLTPGSYQVGMTVFQASSGYTVQVMLGILPVIAGIVGMSPGPNVWDYS